MPRIKNNRKALFLSALARCELTQTQWAARNGLTREHLGRVVNGRYASPPVFAKIDAFVADIAAKVMAA